MRRVFFGAVLASAIMASGCGGSDRASRYSPGEPTKPPLEGVYELKGVVQETQIPGGKKGETAEQTMYLVCADDDCTELLQRSDDVIGTLYSGTVRLERDGNELSAVAPSAGECPNDPSKVASDELTWSWKAGDDGYLTGTVVQVFTGCDGKELTSRTKLTATPDADGRMPWLEGSEADKIKAAISAYDTEVTKVYAKLPECNEMLGDPAKYDTLADCFTTMFDTWAGALEKLSPELARITGGDGPCSTSLTKAKKTVRPVATKSEAALAAFRKNATAGSQIDYELVRGAIVANEPFQSALALTARNCVAPDDVDGLGDDGKLSLDVNEIVIPKPAK